MDKYINADELKQQMIKYGWKHPDSTVHEFVDDMPAADVVEVKHGHWIKTHEYGNDDPVQCSVCLMEFDYIDGVCYLTDEELPNFCPNCGADMRGEDNDQY